jgi:murein L,D-transpeptidase YcbB/YkuD
MELQGMGLAGIAALVLVAGAAGRLEAGAEGVEPRRAVETFPGEAAVELLAAAAADGLDPADYDAPGLAARARAAIGPAEREQVAAEIDAALARFLADLAGGRVEPAARGVVEDGPRAPGGAVSRARAAIAGGDVRLAAQSLRPRHPAYARLAAGLERWRERARQPPPPEVPPAVKVRPGDGWEGMPALRARLEWLGDLPPGGEEARVVAAPAAPAATAAAGPGGPAAPVVSGPGRPEARADGPPPYAGEAVEAVRRFQARHGIAADGVLGRATVAALNVPAARRVRQIELAMERLRWLPDPGRRLVHVEVPRAVIRATHLEGGGPELQMRIVVGRGPEHETPMLASRITGVVFRPYWVPPPEIVREEILPLERRKPGWLAAHGMEIVARGEADAPGYPHDEATLADVERGRLTLRQRPGPRNDLGPIKFVVPNPACIGLHGTPHRQLFDRPRRDRSHGCVRLEDPVALAAWVLDGQDGWDRRRIEAALRRGGPSGVRLREPVALAVSYATASVDPDGTEYFSEDLYGLDAALEAALAARAQGASGPPAGDAGAGSGVSAPRGP